LRKYNESWNLWNSHLAYSLNRRLTGVMQSWCRFDAKECLPSLWLWVCLASSLVLIGLSTIGIFIAFISLSESMRLSFHSCLVILIPSLFPCLWCSFFLSFASLSIYVVWLYHLVIRSLRRSFEWIDNLLTFSFCSPSHPFNSSCFFPILSKARQELFRNRGGSTKDSSLQQERERETSDLPLDKRWGWKAKNLLTQTLAQNFSLAKERKIYRSPFKQKEKKRQRVLPQTAWELRRLQEK
jgi:hypothetical protein